MLKYMIIFFAMWYLPMGSNQLKFDIFDDCVSCLDGNNMSATLKVGCIGKHYERELYLLQVKNNIPLDGIHPARAGNSRGNQKFGSNCKMKCVSAMFFEKWDYIFWRSSLFICAFQYEIIWGKTVHCTAVVHIVVIQKICLALSGHSILLGDDNIIEYWIVL